MIESIIARIYIQLIEDIKLKKNYSHKYNQLLQYELFLGSSRTTIETTCVILVTISIISHERGKTDGILITTTGLYTWLSVTQVFRNYLIVTLHMSLR